MTRKSGGVMLLLTLASAVGFAPVQGQRGAGFRGQGEGPHMGRSLDVLVENQEELGLTKDQLDQILELKTVMDAEVAPLAEEIRALRGRIQAGEVDRGEGFRQLQALRGKLMTASAPLRRRVPEILTIEQHERLQAGVWGGRAGRGRGMASPGRGGQGIGRGQARGSRGGFGPRQGFNGQGRAPAFGFRHATPGMPEHQPGNRAMRSGPGRIGFRPIGTGDGGNLSSER